MEENPSVLGLWVQPLLVVSVVEVASISFRKELFLK